MESAPCARKLPQKPRFFVNVDGEPISDSSGGQFWPILMMPINMKMRTPFLVGLYYGQQKPKNANDFLRDFVDDAKLLIEKGFEFNNKLYGFEIYAFVCDTPARAFILYTKGHSGYSSCYFCCVTGENVGNIVFIDTNAPLRNDRSFRRQTDEDHHNGRSILEEIPGLDMINAFPNDPMHLFDLGLMRKFLYLLTRGPLRNRFQASEIRRINGHVEIIKCFVPREFARKCRSLTFLSSFKANEFAMWNAYIGPVLLMTADINKRSKRLYNHFIVFHVVIRLLSCKEYCLQYSDYVQQLLIILIEEGIAIYGESFATPNTHAALHIVLNVLIFGPLPFFSAYPFENFLQLLKKLLRKSDKPLQQVIKRIYEMATILSGKVNTVRSRNAPKFGKEHFNGPLTAFLSHSKQYESVQLGPSYLCPKSEGDRCAYIEINGITAVVDIDNVIACPKGLFIVGKRFTRLDNVFTYPVESSKLDIFRVSKISDALEHWPLSAIKFKAFKFPITPAGNCTEFAVVPLLMEPHD